MLLLKKIKLPAFVVRAERAFRRVAYNLKIKSRTLGVPIIVLENGKVVQPA